MIRIPILLIQLHIVNMKGEQSYQVCYFIAPETS